MIIDSTYFIGKETYIPNAVLQPSIGSNNISAASELLQEIEDKESELMLDVLEKSFVSDSFKLKYANLVERRYREMDLV